MDLVDLADMEGECLKKYILECTCGHLAMEWVELTCDITTVGTRCFRKHDTFGTAY